METNNLLLALAAIITAGGALITAIRTNRKIKKTKAEEEETRARAARIIEDTAADQVIRVREEAERVALQMRKEREQSGRWEAECTSLRREVAELTCRMDTDMDACKQEIRLLQTQVELLKEKNTKLLEAIEKLVKQVKQRGEIPNCPAELIGDGE
jgi:chromosome segregation ATPase